jgi:hypothetical protein
VANHISTAELDPFIANMHTALWCLAGVSLLGAAISAARPKHVPGQPGSSIVPHSEAAQVRSQDGQAERSSEPVLS